MPFFKRRDHESFQPNLQSVPQAQHHLQPQMHWPPQQPAMNQHQLSELQDLHLRMQKLQMQMDQLATSVKAKRASDPSTNSHPVNAADPASCHSTGPGPCPFPPYPDIPRFEELDESESRASAPTESTPSSQRRGSPSTQAQSGQEVDLEQLLREGSRARARSASPAMGDMPSGHYQAQAYPSNMDSFSSPFARAPSQPGIHPSFGCEAGSGFSTASAVPRQGGTPAHGMPVFPAAFAGANASGAFGSEYSPMHGMPMAHTSLPDMAASYPGQTFGMYGSARPCYVFLQDGFAV